MLEGPKVAEGFVRGRRYVYQLGSSCAGELEVLGPRPYEDLGRCPSPVGVAQSKPGPEVGGRVLPE